MNVNYSNEELVNEFYYDKVLLSYDNAYLEYFRTFEKVQERRFCHGRF